jgi:hypothetical protein
MPIENKQTQLITECTPYDLFIKGEQFGFQSGWTQEQRDAVWARNEWQDNVDQTITNLAGTPGYELETGTINVVVNYLDNDTTFLETPGPTTAVLERTAMTLAPGEYMTTSTLVFRDCVLRAGLVDSKDICTMEIRHDQTCPIHPELSEVLTATGDRISGFSSYIDRGTDYSRTFNRTSHDCQSEDFVFYPESIGGSGTLSVPDHIGDGSSYGVLVTNMEPELDLIMEFTEVTVVDNPTQGVGVDILDQTNLANKIVMAPGGTFSATIVDDHVYGSKCFMVRVWTSHHPSNGDGDISYPMVKVDITH